MKLLIDRMVLRYPNGTTAVDDLSLEVSGGEIFGLVGPNGAGKSSLLKGASGLHPLTGGRVLLDGADVTGDARRTAEHLSLMPDPLGVYTDLSAREYLEFFARTRGLKPPERGARIARTAERLGLGPWLSHEVETLSAGWQRRLALGRVLIAETPVLLLDEPAAGLDIVARTELLGLVRGIAAEGRTVLVTSHILGELEKLADRFGIIRGGRWVPFEGDRVFFSRADLARGRGERRWYLRVSDPVRAMEVLAGSPVEREGEGLRVVAGDDNAAAQLVARLSAAGVAVFEFRPMGADLSQVTLDLLHDGV